MAIPRNFSGFKANRCHSFSALLSCGDYLFVIQTQKVNSGIMSILGKLMVR